MCDRIHTLTGLSANNTGELGWRPGGLARARCGHNIPPMTQQPHQAESSGDKPLVCSERNCGFRATADMSAGGTITPH